MTGETKQIGKLTVDMGDNTYELHGGSGEAPAPNTVGSEQIIDDSIEMEDLNRSVKDKMVTDDDRVTPDDLANFVV